ncbi:MAG: hypothetical protein WC781_05200 [Candidatus Pacearchaeota archaeon]|jgi:hypothetical protein
MTNRGVKAITVLITLGILSLLIIAAPAQAFALSFVISDPYVSFGQTTEFTVSSKIGPNENIVINQFILNIYGPETITCEFLPDGTLLNDCDGITITPLQNINTTNSSCYGYNGENNCGGYGYGYGYDSFTNQTLAYKISFDTGSHKPGIYQTEFVLLSEGKRHVKPGSSLFIFDRDGLRGCSVRAHKGILEIGNQTIDSPNNKLSFNVPLENAVLGSGSMLVQADKERFVYNFKVKGVLENNENNALVLVEGDYKSGRLGNSTSEIAIISIDKKNKELSLAGKKITATNMNVNLLTKKCL